MKMEYFDGGQWVSLSTPKVDVPINSGLDWVNGNQKGFRWGHYTDPANPLGMFHLSQLSWQQSAENSGYLSTRLLTFNDQGNDAFTFFKKILVSHSLDMLNHTIANLGSIAGKITSTENNFQVYLRASSNTLDLRGGNVRGSKVSAIIETNAFNETASIAMNGDYIQTIQTFDDLGFIFTDEDMDPATTYQSYISANGTLVTSSSVQRKHSLRQKQRKDYLARLNQLNVYSYGLRVPVLPSDDHKRKSRKYYKNRHLHVGLLAEEVETLFDNATDRVKVIALNQDNQKEFGRLTKNYTPSETEAAYLKRKNASRHSPGIRYDTLLCYTILAVQELTQRLISLEQKISSKS